MTVPEGGTAVPTEIDVEAAASLLRGTGPDRPLLLDCRTVEEHTLARIEGSILIPIQELPQRIDELDRHRDGTVIVHCHHGVRSLRVVNWLRERGFPRATSMAGGIDAWSTRVDQRVPRY